MEGDDSGIENIDGGVDARNQQERARSTQLAPDAAPTAPTLGPNAVDAAAVKTEGNIPHASGINASEVGRVNIDGGVPVSGLPLHDKEGAAQDVGEMVMGEVVVGKNRPGNIGSVNLCDGDKPTGKNGNENEGKYGKYGIGDVDDIDDDDTRSGAEDGDDGGWDLIEAGERTGYAGATVELFAVKEGVDGMCVTKVCRAAGWCIRLRP